MADAPVRDATPRLAEWQERVIRGVAVVTILYSTYYIVWRWLETIHWSAWWFSVPLALGETYIVFSAALMVFTAWKMRRRDPPPAPDGLAVDVFITTYDESLEIIRRTALAARAIRYPHETYILDDGKRDEIRDLADELGVGYIRREGNEHAKAGNLNNALGVTSGEFVLQLDADHVPLPHILDRLLGFFNDPDVAFAQSPQDFYNTDSFSYDVNEEAHRLWEEQRIFFSLIQPGKDHWNAAFFCGSCGVLRRSAFEEIGGFQTRTITEDMETSLVLHSRGWKSVYYGESLAYGLAPASAGQYAVQRLRWGQGSMQTLRKYNPLFHRGLSLPQRICYFNSTISYLDGPLKLILYLAPVIFFFTGILPIWVDETAFLIRFVPFLVLNLVMFEMLFRGTGFLLIAERYNMAKFWIFTRAISGFFARGTLAFNVTPKGEGEVPFQSYAPQLVLAVVTVVSLLWATLAYSMGWIDYSAPGWASGAFWFNFLWAAYNLYFATYVVRLSLRYKQQRTDERFQASLPLELTVREDGPGSTARSIPAVTTNLNPGGMAIRTPSRIAEGSSVDVVLPLATGDVRVTGTVSHEETGTAGDDVIHTYGIAFDDLPTPDRDAIDLHCTQHAVPVHRASVQEAKRPFQQLVEWIYDPRREPRTRIDLPAVVRASGNGRAPGPEQLGHLLDTSESGARLVVGDPPSPGARLLYRVLETGLSGQGEVATVRALGTTMGTRYAVGLRVDADVERLVHEGGGEPHESTQHEAGT
jgi:cellulose synthase (UDP-forming)